jgi:small GTP-binding protein
VTLGNRKIELSIWDTAGQEAYRGLTAQYYRDAQIALIVFDLANPATMTSVREWNTSLQQANTEEVLVVLVGNKSDLPNRVIDLETGEEAAAQIGAFYRETSALSGYGVSEVFEDVCEEYIRRHPTDVNPVHRADLIISGSEERGGCC